MNVNATMEKLRDMRLDGMADAYERQRTDPASAELSFDQRFGMLVESLWLHENNRALQRRLAAAKLRQNASIEQIDWRQSLRTKLLDHRINRPRQILVGLRAGSKGVPQRLSGAIRL